MAGAGVVAGHSGVWLASERAARPFGWIREEALTIWGAVLAEGSHRDVGVVLAICRCSSSTWVGGS